jgi:hypothetical protein
MATAGRDTFGFAGRLAMACACLALLATGCGGGGTGSTASPTSVPAPSSQTTQTVGGTSTSSSTELSATSTTNGRIPVSTTLPPPGADTAIGPGLVPEATATYEFDKSVINGIEYSNALLMSSSTYQNVTVEINAGRSRTRFLGTLGVPDNQKSSSVHQIEISLDGAAPVLSTTIGFGETKAIDIDVTKVLRIRITVLKTSSSGYLAIGDPRLT